jgi:hypothetical protein
MITKNVMSEELAGYIIPVRKDYITFIVLDQNINFISDECYFGLNTVAEIDDEYYYLGKVSPNISMAILAWQEANNREFTNEELRQVLTDNNVL